MNLREKVKSLKREGIKFMEGREKGDLSDLFDKVVTVRDYDFINGDDGEYLVFIVDEDKTKFYFGGSVLTNDFKQFDDENKKELQDVGLKIKLFNKKGKKHNYTSVEYVEEDETIGDDLPF